MVFKVARWGFPGPAVLLYEEEGLGPMGRLLLLTVPQAVPGVAHLPQDAARHAVHAVQLPVLRHGHHNLAEAEAVRGLVPA